MSANSTYPSSLYNQYNIAFEGSSVACVLYGIYLAIAAINLTLLNKQRLRALFWFTAFQLVLTTLYLAISLYAAPAQSLAIFSINGDTYTPNALSPWPSVLVNVAFVLNTWASDAFLLYRCYTIWAGNRHASVFLAVLYLATISSSLAWLIVSSEPGALYSTHAVQVTGTCYWSFSAATSVCASCLISTRLWTHRRAMSQPVRSARAGSELGYRYMTMTLESALLYTVFVILALVAFTINSPLENVFFPVLGIVQVIAPSLIVLRTVRGRRVVMDGNPRAGLQDVRDGLRTARRASESSSSFTREFKEAV